MSTRRGATTRSGSPKHKNRTAFKNDLHDKTPQMKKINSLHVCEVCQRCKAQIEWKIKYKKYKPLTQAKTCTRCQQRNVKKAYHVICRDCSRKDRVCAKCLKSADDVNIEPPGPSEQEQVQLQVEMDRLIKSFSERKRRTFLRYMKKGKENEEDPGAEDADDKKTGEDNKDKKTQKRERIPHSRDDLLKKIEELQLDGDDDVYEDFSSDSDSDIDDFHD